MSTTPKFLFCTTIVVIIFLLPLSRVLTASPTEPAAFNGKVAELMSTLEALSAKAPGGHCEAFQDQNLQTVDSSKDINSFLLNPEDLHPGSKVILLVSADQVINSVPFDNWTEERMDGFCLSITCINTALMTDNLRFEEVDPHGEVDSDETIEQKIRKAILDIPLIYDRSPQTIYGFKSKQEFLEKMKERAGERYWSNPLRGAIYWSQFEVRKPEKFGLNPKEWNYDEDTRTTALEYRRLIDDLDSGIPSYIVTSDLTSNKPTELQIFSHISTVVGYTEWTVENGEGRRQLIIIDPNSPRKLVIANLGFSRHAEFNDEGELIPTGAPMLVAKRPNDSYKFVWLFHDDLSNRNARDSITNGFEASVYSVNDDGKLEESGE